MSVTICQTTFCEHVRCNAIKKLQATGTFLREFISAPSYVGSVCPSSKALTAALISSAPINGDGLIIDLGAGSGVVSEELVKAGVAPERIMAVEISSGFSNVFNKRCPDVPLIIGDARALESMITRHNPSVGVSAIISSLPLRVIPSGIVVEIMNEMQSVLSKKGGVLIQYTYAWWMRYPLRRYGFTPCSARVVLGNLPPAKVESYAV
ncbi:MAG: hypothetical protein DELT_02848 [Desulfovibrio sp.]